MKSLLTSIILILVATLAFGAEPVKVPDLTNYTHMGVKLVQCPVGVLVIQAYNENGTNPTEAEVMTYGPSMLEEPILYLVFAADVDGPPTHGFLALPGKPVEKLTFREIQDRYPGPCDLALEAGKPV